MKTKTNYYQMNGQTVTGRMESVRSHIKYIRERIDTFEKGDPYPMAYMVANTVVKLILQKNYSNVLKEIKDNLYHTYLILSNNTADGQCYPLNDKANDVLQQAVLFCYECNGYYKDAQKALRAWMAQQKNGWVDAETVYYEDYNTGEIKRLPTALICAIDGTGKACTVSSYTVDEITALLDKIPLSPTERKYLALKLQEHTEEAIAERYGKAKSTVNTTLTRARSKARHTLMK